MSNPLMRLAQNVFAWPLIQRELVALLRTRRAFWLLLMSTLVSFLVPLARWPSGSGSIAFFDENVVVFLMFIVTQLVVALLIVPAVTAGAFAGERERETYDLLHSTLLPPSSIVVSKFLAALGYVVLLLVAAAPAGCLLYMLGGLGLATVLETYAVVFACVLSSGVVCLAISMRCHRTTHAAIRGYVWVAVWHLGVYLLLGLSMQLAYLVAGDELRRLLLEDESMVAQVNYLMNGLCPIPVVAGLAFGDAIHRPTGMQPIVPVWLAYVGYAGAISLFHFAYLLRRVRRPDAPAERASRVDGMAHDSDGSRPSVQRRRRRRQKRQRRLALGTRVLLRHGEQEATVVPNPFANPVFAKELRAEFIGRAWYRSVLFWPPLALFVITAVATEWEWETAMFIALFALGMIVLIVPGTSATCVTKEIEQGNFDLLRSTLLPMRRILSGKLFAALFGGLGIVAAAAIALALVGVFDPSNHSRGRSYYRDMSIAQKTSAIAMVVTVLFLTAVFLTCLGGLFSATSRRSMAALVKTYAAAAALFLGVPFLWMTMMFGGSGSEGAVQLAAAMSPFGTCVWILATTFRASTDDGPVSVFVTFVFFYGPGSVLLWIGANAYFRAHRLRDDG